MRITLSNPKRFSKVFKTVTNTSFTSTVLGISTDTRQCIEGDLYIAIKGDNVDGNQFINEAQEAGRHSVQFNGDNLSNGIYFYRIKVNNYKVTKQMLLVK